MYEYMWCILAPFLASIAQDEMKENYLIFALDGCLGPKKTTKRAEQHDTLIQTELNELQTKN